MRTIEAIVREINRELVPEFETRLREHLATRDREWLVEQIVRLTLDAHSLHEKDRRNLQEAKETRRQQRLARLRELALDRDGLERFIERHAATDRDRLIADGCLLATAPPKGGDLIADAHRTPRGNALLAHAKDVLFGLLFGDTATGTRLERTSRELLTLAVPRDKSDCLDFMKAATELAASGTWQDPERVASDQHADNVLLEVEYGEIDGERVGHGIVRALALINCLEINEQVLYARMIDVEQTTLIG